MAGADVLQFLGEEMLRLPGPGPWISVKRFSTSGSVTVGVALEALITHPDYLDAYAGDHVTGRTQDVHGPYRVDVLEAGKFKPTNAAEALIVVRSWLEELYDGRMPTVETQSVVDWVTPPLSTGALYTLTSLSEADWHENGWIVGVNGFHEWIAVGEAGLCVIVASDD